MRIASHDCRLEEFKPAQSLEILSWVESELELTHWVARYDYPLNDPAIFQTWHQDADVIPSVLVRSEQTCGYGEIWLDPTDGTAELARLIVAPALRGQG